MNTTRDIYDFVKEHDFHLRVTCNPIEFCEEAVNLKAYKMFTLKDPESDRRIDIYTDREDTILGAYDYEYPKKLTRVK